MKKTILKSVAFAAALSLATVNISFAAGGSVGHGNINVYKEGQLATKLIGQNPVEDGALLVCDGKCMLKSAGISVIAEDKSQIAVTNEVDTFKLYVKEGSVDYVISSNARKIAFYTPQGTYTVAEVVFNASSDSVVKGSVVVGSDGSTEITVTEGKMVFATADGMKTVDANNKIVLAVAPTTTTTAMSPLVMVGGGLLAAGIVYGVYDATKDDDNPPPGNTQQSQDDKPGTTKPKDKDEKPASPSA